VSTTIGQNQRNVAQAVIQPRGVTDDLGWKSILAIRGRLLVTQSALLSYAHHTR
jgi:hypothetical protein